MDIAPVGTVDPTPLLYNNAYVALSAFTVGALGCAVALKVPCDSKHHMNETETATKE